jgi:hypothetical protein
MLLAKTLRRKAVPNKTFKKRELTVSNLINWAIAFRARDRNLVARRFAGRTVCARLVFDTAPSIWRFSDVGGAAVGQLHKNLSDLTNWKSEIHINHAERVLRHTGCDSLIGILHNGDATTGFDCEQPSRAVVAATAQDHPDDSRAMSASRAAEQNIDCGPVAVFSRPAFEDCHVILNRQMTIRRCAVNAATPVPCSVFGNNGG